MPKLIKHFDVAEFKSVKKISGMEYEEWKWRKQYLGYQGELYLFESVHQSPGKQYLHFTDRHEYIKTGLGECVIDANKIMLTSRNSIYTFRILHGGEAK